MAALLRPRDAPDLRHGLPTLLARREPKAIIELVGLLTDDGLRAGTSSGARLADRSETVHPDN